MDKIRRNGESPSRTRLLVTVLLNFGITAVEIVGGVASGSLSLISDALHNAVDGLSVFISYVALRLAGARGSASHTFGLKRAQIMAAVVNSAILIGITLFLFYEAAGRFLHPQPVNAGIMSLVAGIGLAANILGTLLLKKDAARSLNIRSSYLHLLSDAVSSLAVLLAGLAIAIWNVLWIDPLLTILVGLYILKESIDILREAGHVLMEGAPPDVSLEAIRTEVLRFDRVRDLHHVHLWTVGENDLHLQAHLVVEDMLVSQGGRLCRKIRESLDEKFGINHVTLQTESKTPDEEDPACEGCGAPGPESDSEGEMKS